MDRRYFIKTSGIGLASFGLMAAAPEFLHQFATAQTKNAFGKKKVLVTVWEYADGRPSENPRKLR